MSLLRRRMMKSNIVYGQSIGENLLTNWNDGIRLTGMGEESMHNSFATTEYIPIIEQYAYSIEMTESNFTDTRDIFFYNNNKECVARETIPVQLGPQPITFLEGTKYIRFCTYKSLKEIFAFYRTA